MQETNLNTVLTDKLIELNELESSKAKILTIIFMKKTRDIINKKIQSLEFSFEEQANFYGQNLEDYKENYTQIVSKYKAQLSQIIEKYNQLYINMQLELQEAECNQKIAIINLKKSFEIKQELSEKQRLDLLEEYNKKIGACMNKKTNYETIIQECEKELNTCANNMEKKINSLFVDKSNQVALREENVFKKFISKISNFFTGANKFNTYVIEPLNVELEMMDNKLPDIQNDIYQETIKFVAKMKYAKDQTNTIFDNMING